MLLINIENICKIRYECINSYCNYPQMLVIKQTIPFKFLASSVLYQLPVTAVTIYHKLCGSKQHKLILFQLWRLEVQTQSYRAINSRAGFSWGASGKNPFLGSCSCQWLLTFLGSWLRHSNLCFRFYMAFSLNLILLSPS